MKLFKSFRFKINVIAPEDFVLKKKVDKYCSFEELSISMAFLDNNLLISLSQWKETISENFGSVIVARYGGLILKGIC